MYGPVVGRSRCAAWIAAGITADDWWKGWAVPVSQKTITPLLSVPCDTCGDPVRGDTMHVFEDTKGVAIGKFCRDCCPRCEHA